MQKSTPNALLGWKTNDCKREQIPEVKVSSTAFLWLDCSPFLFPRNITRHQLTYKEDLGNTNLLEKLRVCGYSGCIFLQGN